MPSLAGKNAIVTGANSGVGFEIALALAAKGAFVVLASRDAGRTSHAANQIKARLPDSLIEPRALDLADLASVFRFASKFNASCSGLDILINNAGVSGGPRRETRDGFEIHFGVNYLGHFALTGLLLPSLLMRRDSRVVNMSSDIAARGRIDFNDLQCQRDYGLVKAYAQAKLANLIFAFELERRCRQAQIHVCSFATNPGVAKSNLLSHRETEWGRPANLTENLLRMAQRILALPASRGALPALYQATDPEAQTGEYIIGTTWPNAGYPRKGKIPTAALDQGLARRLWEVSEKLTGGCYDILGLNVPERSSEFTNQKIK
jgi:NAD(P)-dependent dehydrogenase (short-subunit alcohol dehydrogenase family)